MIREHKALFGVVLLFGAYLLAAIAALLRQPQPQPGHVFFSGSRFLVIAHRGGRDIGPENTLENFQKSLDLGTDVLEMDVRLSNDGVLVVHHDATVNRTTDGLGRVDSLTLRQLQALDAGYRWTQDGVSFPYRGKGYRVPSLSAVFDAFPGQRMLIELKVAGERAARELCSAIRNAGMQDHVIQASFRDESIRVLRDACPEVISSASLLEVTSYVALYLPGLSDLYVPEFGLFSVPERVGRMKIVTRQFVEETHKRNLPVYVWTVNEEEVMERLIDVGVDGIVTDHPQRLFDVLKRMGIR